MSDNERTSTPTPRTPDVPSVDKSNRQKKMNHIMKNAMLAQADVVQEEPDSVKAETKSSVTKNSVTKNSVTKNSVTKSDGVPETKAYIKPSKLPEKPVSDESENSDYEVNDTTTGDVEISTTFECNGCYNCNWTGYATDDPQRCIQYN